MRAYRKDFEETKYISFLIKDDELLEKHNEIWEKIKIVSQNSFAVNQYTMTNIQKLKQNPIMEKSTQLFMIIKYQNKVLNLFVYQ